MIINGHEYTTRNPAEYGTDTLLLENRKKLFRQRHPATADMPREMVRALYGDWNASIEDTLTDAKITLGTILIPVGDAPDFLVAPEEYIAKCNSFEIRDALDFFTSARAKAYFSHKGLPMPGETTQKTSNQATETALTSESTSPSNLKTDLSSTSLPKETGPST